MDLRRNFSLKIKEEVVLKEEEDSDCQIHQALPSDVQKVIIGEEQQQERSSTLDQDQEDPEPPHIKEEQEEPWSSQEGEQLLPVPVKSEEDEEKPQSSQQNTDFKASGSSETEVSDGDWEETREPQSGSESQKNNEVAAGDSGERSYNCSECGQRFHLKANLKRHMITHTGEKPFSCSVCKKTFAWRGRLQNHIRIHTGERPFSCSVCGKAFIESGNLKRHMRVHTGEKPFSCSMCDQRFTWYDQLKNHQCAGLLHQRQMEAEADGDTDEKAGDDNGDLKETREPQSGSNALKKHNKCSTKEKPFSCSECGKRFGRRTTLREHMTTHTGEKPFSCSMCGKRFRRNRVLLLHIKTHTGEKPFSCSFCGKNFTEKATMMHHMRIHTGEKPFSCSVCDKRFAWRSQVKTHKCVDQSQTENRETEPPASCSTGHMETEASGEDCGGPGLDRNCEPDPHIESDTDEKTGDSFVAEIEVSCDDWEETR
ncbi:zinc finger protein OZF-like [Centropristis striata]|uniref:zinc finger protein OZF-like n=1 Tax=Centropristis striata TaxID=184440 RepID=UPI0027E098AB|nr:zinc finger protein OZF-like [Centropristis striata]XP_059205803.1 zinc finger protein OZF-like [Centropristis striata]